MHRYVVILVYRQLSQGRWTSLSWSLELFAVDYEMPSLTLMLLVYYLYALALSTGSGHVLAQNPFSND